MRGFLLLLMLVVFPRIAASSGDSSVAPTQESELPSNPPGITREGQWSWALLELVDSEIDRLSAEEYDRIKTKSRKMVTDYVFKNGPLYGGGFAILFSLLPGGDLVENAKAAITGLTLGAGLLLWGSSWYQNKMYQNLEAESPEVTRSLETAKTILSGLPLAQISGSAEAEGLSSEQIKAKFERAKVDLKEALLYQGLLGSDSHSPAKLNGIDMNEMRESLNAREDFSPEQKRQELSAYFDFHLREAEIKGLVSREDLIASQKLDRLQIYAIYALAQQAIVEGENSLAGNQLGKKMEEGSLGGVCRRLVGNLLSAKTPS
jgi:hypothetical protein